MMLSQNLSLSGYNLTKHTADCSADDEDIGLLHHRIVEAWKFAYASRSQLGDGEFVDNSQVCFHCKDQDW